MDPATKQDIEALDRKIDQIKLWMMEREVISIRWFVGTQITCFVLTLGAMYFMLGRVAGHL